MKFIIFNIRFTNYLTKNKRLIPLPPIPLPWTIVTPNGDIRFEATYDDAIRRVDIMRNK